MSEEPRTGIRLSLLTERIKSVIHDGIGDQEFWVMAEILSLNGSSAGHYFMKLVENYEGKKIAQCEARIWNPSGSIIVTGFKKAAGIDLSEGVEILCRVKVQYHDVYSITLTVLEIDPSYTVGKMALQKELNIKKLKDEGYLDANKMKQIPTIIQTVAVIASTTSAGLDDFLNTIKDNKHGFVLKYCLYKSTVQGEGAEAMIMRQFERIEKSKNHYDAIVLIRGGGGKDDLSCFDSYRLGKAIGTCRYPVLTGIGHTRDVSIVDMAAYKALKTPTDVANTILSMVDKVIGRIKKARVKIVSMATTIVQNERKNIIVQSHVVKDHIQNEVSRRMQRLMALRSNVAMQVSRLLDAQQRDQAIHIRTIKMSAAQIVSESRKDARTVRSMISTYSTRIVAEGRRKNAMFGLRLESGVVQSVHMSKVGLVNNKRSCIEWCMRVVRDAESLLSAHNRVLNAKDPDTILKQGFSFTYCNGKAVVDTEALSIGDEIETRVYKGTILSAINKLEKKDERSEGK